MSTSFSQLILQGPEVDNKTVNQIASQLKAKETTSKNTGKPYYRLSLAAPLDSTRLHQLRQQYPFDINPLPAGFDPGNIRLLLTDMDSTLISIECIDEIADFLDIKPQVAEITEAAMRGEIDFETSLKKRIQLLLGLDDSALQHVYDERLKLNPGAEIMLQGLQQNNIKVALVSGGFTYFTQRLQQRLHLDFTLANELAFDKQGKLTGIANDVIVGAQRKADYLTELCTVMSITPDQVIAMGDGANDLLMMERAGLSIAYHAKPTVQQQASCALNHCGLEGVLELLGIGETFSIPTQTS
jgi:phosphoserine phosphatase